MIKILIADDHQMVIDGLKALLSGEDIHIVGQALSGNDVIAFLSEKKHDVDILILDINMPGMDGIETAKLIRKQYPHIRILVLSMYNKPVFIRNLVEVGVSGYILKNTGKEELLNAIHRIHSGQDYFSADVTKTIMSSFKGQDASSEGRLTRREEEIIRLLVKAHTTAEIAEMLFVSTHTIDTHRKNILSKLGLKNTPALIKYAVDNGYSDARF